MRVAARRSFERDIKKIKDQTVKQKIKAAIQEMQAAEKISDLPQIKKLAGHPYAYRVRVGNYRIGFYYLDEQIILARVKDRKDLYTYFPE